MPHARNSRPDLVMESSSSYDDDEKQTFICLFCPHPSPTLTQFHTHTLTTHQINLPPLLAPLSFYQRIRFINYCRARTRDGFGVGDVMDGWVALAGGGGMDEDEGLLVPVLADDAVLINLDDDESGEWDEEEGGEGLDGMEDEDEEEDEEEWDDEDDEEDAEDEDIESTVRQCQQHERQHISRSTTAFRRCLSALLV